MSDAMTSDRREDQTVRTNHAPSTSALRVWPAVVMVLAYWAFLRITYTIGMSNFERFISQFAALVVLFLAFSVWWFSRRAIRWRDRLLAVVVVLLIAAGTYFVADKSMDAFGLFLSAFPFIVTVGTAWLVIGRFLTPVVRRVGFCLAMLLTIGYFGLVRFDGLDASQWGETSWRWQPSKEQIFLASRTSRNKAAGVAGSGSASPWTPQPGDCLEYRGPQRDGVVANVQLASDWKQHPPKLLWRERVGPSWSTMVAVDGHVVTQEQQGDAEVVVCRDAATGQETWVHKDPVRFEEKLSGAGPRGTPTFADGRVYALGAKGNLNCLNAQTGEVVWSHDIVADAGVEPAEIPQWGYSGSPLVVDGLVVVFAGGSKDKSILAYRADSGELAWSCAGGKQSYSSPQLATLVGEKQIVMHDNAALRGINIADGTQLWQHVNGSEFAVPMVQPHQTESGELVVSSEPGLTLLKFEKAGDEWTVTPGWTTNRFRPGFNDFVLHEGYLYGLDDGILCAFDLATGERAWKKGRLGHGQILLLPEQYALVVSTDKGEIVHVSVTPKGYEELGRFKAIEGKTWNGPVLAGGRLYLRNGEEMAAYEMELNGAPSEPVARK
jgi:outer membrane protein assembly factor BamB